MYRVYRADGFVIAECKDYSTAMEFMEADTSRELEFVDEDEEPDYEDSFDEVGYDPYMGCYSWDC